MAGWLIRAEEDAVEVTAIEPEPEPDSAAGIETTTSGKPGATGPPRTGKNAAERRRRSSGYRAEVRDVINRVNAQLRTLGADALSPSGSEELRQQILANALADAERIFDAGTSSAAATQREVNQLTAVYLDALDPTPTNTPVSGTVGQWINQAIAILEQLGYPAAELNPTALAIVIDHESSGNPYATNLTDSNAAAGDPSKGLMQTISTTFAAYAAPGHPNIWNPVDNIVAGARYAISRYGSLNNIPGVVAVEHGRAYVG